MSVKILTDIPGPRSLELAKRRSNSVAQGHGTVCYVYIVKGEGSILTDVDNNVFIDFAGGIGTINVGHSHPKVIDAINNQIKNYLHTCFTVAPYESYITLAEKLSSIAPIKTPCKAAFFNSGAEAEENAVKIANEIGGVAIGADLTDSSQTKKLFKEIIEKEGGIDVCVANAGKYPKKFAPLWELDDERLNDTFNTNLSLTLNTSREFLKHASQTKQGSLVFVGSTAGTVSYTHLTLPPIYSV